MSITTTTHLNFRGQARAALEFYQSVFGGDLTAITYQDAHAVTDPAEADQIATQAEIRRIDAALARIEAGDYGDCVRCGNPIAEKRLQLLPDTPFCANCSP